MLCQPFLRVVKTTERRKNLIFNWESVSNKISTHICQIRVRVKGASVKCLGLTSHECSTCGALSLCNISLPPQWLSARFSNGSIPDCFYTSSFLVTNSTVILLSLELKGRCTVTECTCTLSANLDGIFRV